MDWYHRLLREGTRTDGEESSLLYHPALAPAAPPEYVVPGMVGLTFRLHRREDDRFVFATVIDLPAAIRLGERLGLHPALGVAFVDSHERLHVQLQLEGVPEEVEEEHSRFVDAVWLSLHSPSAERLVGAGEFGLVEKVGRDFWERLVDEAQGSGEAGCLHAATRPLAGEKRSIAPGGSASLLECLDCGRVLEPRAPPARDGQGGRDPGGAARPIIAREEAVERAHHAGGR